MNYTPEEMRLSLPVRQSLTLRRKACNEFLIGMLTGIADFEGQRDLGYTMMLREKIDVIFGILHEIEVTEKMMAELVMTTKPLEDVWSDFLKNLHIFKAFLGDKSPLPEYWRKLHRNNLFELIERIILIFSPESEPCED